MAGTSTRVVCFFGMATAPTYREGSSSCHLRSTQLMSIIQDVSTLLFPQKSWRSLCKRVEVQEIQWVSLWYVFVLSIVQLKLLVNPDSCLKQIGHWQNTRNDHSLHGFHYPHPRRFQNTVGSNSSLRRLSSNTVAEFLRPSEVWQSAWKRFWDQGIHMNPS